MPLLSTRGAASARGFGLLGRVKALADPSFNYVTMLLHGDGTNGAQNNTFLDSSTNNFTITRNGNTTQGSFSPYGPNWSTSFNQIAGQVLAIGTNTALDLTGDFTIELWFFANTLPTFSVLWDTSLSGGAGPDMSEGYVYENGRTALYIRGTEVCRTNEGVIVANTWNHIAYTRSGTGCTIWVNGVSRATGTSASGVNTGYTWRIGDRVASAGSGNWPVNGYISNFRIVKGTALYTSTFTPSTTPLTAVSGTSLLTCQSNRFIDNSTNNFAVTAIGISGGTASVQRFSPFAPPAAYSPATIGGSGYFDGAGDYLTAPSNSVFNFGTGDFTVEAWVFRNTATTGYETILGFDVTGGLLFQVYLNQLDFGIRATASNLSGVTVPLNAWMHLAISRQGSTAYMFQNGQLVNTFSNSTNFTNSTAAIISGYSTSAGQLNGYIANLRVVKGTAIYTSAFTPPTAPLTAITNTSLLLNFTNGAIFDNAMMNDLETVGNAQISTSVVKFGTGSMAFDGSGDYLATRSTPNLAFGSGNFTIECWAYANALGSYNGIFAQWPDDGGSANNSYVLETVGSNMVFYWVAGTTLYGPATLGTIATGSWNHWAICRSGNTLYPFKNGVLGTTISITEVLNSPASAVTVGGAVAGGGSWNGYIDDLRITKGVARYTANFTPPTAAFPNN